MSRKFITVARKNDVRPQFDFYRRAAEVSNTYELVWAGSQWKQAHRDFYTPDGEIHRRQFQSGSDDLEVYKVDDYTTYLVDYRWGRVTLVIR